MGNKDHVPDGSKEYELLVREIYQQMLDQEQALNVAVQHNVQVKGRATSHQIDVFWEFCLGGITHKVAVQAKKWRSPIRKGDVLTFKGVLDDLPGTIGIMVTSSHFQKGALEVARTYGIILCNLFEASFPPISMYPGETARFKIKSLLTAKDGGHLGMLVDVEQKVPTVSDLVLRADSEWQRVNDPLLGSMTLKIPEPLQFYDQNGNELFTLRRILGEFYAEMHRDGEMSAKKSHRFENPTFIRLSDPPRTIKEESVSATITFAEKTTEVLFKTKDVAAFILKNISSGAEQRFIAKKLDSGTS